MKFKWYWQSINVASEISGLKKNAGVTVKGFIKAGPNVDTNSVAILYYKS